MKKYSFSILITLVYLLGLMTCASDDQSIMIVDDETLVPIDTMDVEPMRTYARENYSIGDWGLEIYVPSDYDSTSQYPVLYFNDGDLYADVFGSLTSVEAPAFIMVGISGDNSRAERFMPYEDPDVSADLGAYTPNASLYSEAIIEEIMPFVEDKFNIDANKKAIFGISLGGLHATWMAIVYPQVFNFVGALSPSYWVAEEAIFRENLGALDPPGLSVATKIYFDRGSAEWRNHLSFVANLKSAGLVYGRSLFYYEVIGGNHSPEHWQIRIDIPFKLFLEGIGASDEPSQLELRSYCANDLTNNEASTTRVNPIVHYENGIKFSVMSEAEYTITLGSGSIADDGTYSISSGSTMDVEATYKGVTDNERLTDCN